MIFFKKNSKKNGDKNRKSDKKTKLVIFDFDGTLTRNENDAGSWRLLWNALNDRQTDDRYFEIYYDKKITVEEWFVLIDARFKKLGLKRDVLEEYKKIELIDGIGETFTFCKKNDMKILILTSGVRNIIEMSLKPRMKSISSIVGE